MNSRKSDGNGSRKPKAPKNVKRSPRFLKKTDGWYFRTREGVLLGPYAEEFDAEICASLLVAQLAQLEPGTDPTATIQRFIRDPANAAMGAVQREAPKPVDLPALKRQLRIKKQIPTLQKAWGALTARRR